MASWTDKIISFNPYISEVPVDDYVKVGLYKQEQYNQGVQKVQAEIDSISGIEVTKDVHREYLDQTLSNLKQSVGKVVTSDFSNNELTSQISSLTSRMRNDPVIRNAIVSTNNYKAGVAQMQKARSEGKSSVENDFAFQSEAGKWLMDKDVSSSFNGTYTPYKDVRKKMFDIINKELGVDTNLTQIPFKRNPDGSVLTVNGHPQIDTVMLETQTEGKSAEKIRRAVELGLDESDINQLNIEAQYHFRGQDAQGMKNIADRGYEVRLQDINTRLADLQVQRMTKLKDRNFQARINAELAEVKMASENLVKNYKGDMEILNQNPDAFKGRFYTENYLSQVANTFSTSKTAFKYLDNPYQKQVNEDRDFDLKWQQFKESSWLGRAKLSLDASKEDKDKTDKEKMGLISNPLLGADPLSSLTTTSDFIGEIQGTEQALKTSKANILNSEAFRGIPVQDREAKLVQLKQEYDKGSRNSISPILAEYFSATERLDLDLNNKKKSLMEIESQAPSIRDITRNLTGMTIKQPVGEYIYTPEAMAEFNNKWEQVLPDNPITVGGTTSIRPHKVKEDVAKEIFTPSEEVLYNVKKKEFNGEKLTEDDKMVLGKLNTIHQQVNKNNSAVLKARNQFIDNKVRTITSDYQPERYIIDAGNAQKMYLTRARVNDILSESLQHNKTVEGSPEFNYDVASKLNDDKANSTYGVYRKGNKSFITIAGNGEKTQYLPVSSENLNSIFNGAFDRPFDHVQTTLDLTGGRTTNVQGRGAETAYFGKNYFPGVHKYGVKGDIQQGMNGYQLELHIFDPITKQWVSKPAFYGTQEQVMQKMREVGDFTIEQALGLTPEQVLKLEQDK